MKPQPEGESCCCPLIERVSSHLQMPEHTVTSVGSWWGGRGPQRSGAVVFHKGPRGAFLTTSSPSCDVRSCVKSDSPFTVSCISLAWTESSRRQVLHLSLSLLSFKQMCCFRGMQRRPKRSRDSKMINVLGTKSWQHLILFHCRTVTE